MAASAERIPRRILPVIVLAQFAGTSLWFASNAVMGDLQRQWQLPASALGTMTSAVQFGFIAGTLCFAWFAWADRFSSRLLFLVSALLGAAANLMIWLAADGLDSLLLCRFATGFFLAGIYPVGMKIAVAWSAKMAWPFIWAWPPWIKVLGNIKDQSLQNMLTAGPRRP